MRLSELSGFIESSIPAYYCLAQKLLAKGEVGEAESVMKKGDEASRHPTVSPFAQAQHYANRVMFAIQQGDLRGAEDWGGRLEKFPLDSVWVWARHALARLKIPRGENEAAVEQLRDLYQTAMERDALGYAIRIRIYQAIAAPSRKEAVEFVSDALRMGRPEGFVRSFVDEGALLSPILRHAVRSGVEVDYARMLLGVIEAERRQHRPAKEQPAPGGPETTVLSARELAVLRLIEEDLSNQEIAARLVISLNTAKTHVRHILDKLDAKDRLQAVTRAKELNLL